MRSGYYVLLMSTSPSRILLVEDEPLVLEVCQRILRMAGFETMVAQHGKQGLGYYQANHVEIALTITDAFMPILDGIEMARGIFQIDPHAKIILMTGYSPGEAVPEDLKAMCTVLKKPFLPGQLLFIVNNCLGRKYKSQSA
jgi:two-component system, cell cycle sensor histidine kinase and response regulator CckA